MNINQASILKLLTQILSSLNDDISNIESQPLTTKEKLLNILDQIIKLNEKANKIELQHQPKTKKYTDQKIIDEFIEKKIKSSLCKDCQIKLFSKKTE